jgi:hypothetical protein
LKKEKTVLHKALGSVYDDEFIIIGLAVMMNERDTKCADSVISFPSFWRRV